MAYTSTLNPKSRGQTTSNKRRLVEKSIKGYLDILILSLLEEKEMCGYEIIARIHKKFHILLSPGTVYPLLYKLEENGLVETKHVGRKKIYIINKEEQVKAILNDFTDSQKFLMNFVNERKADS